MPDHEVLDVDVLFVGAGPAGLGGAIRLAQLAKAAGKTLNITVIEKAKELGAHTLSGAVMDPKSLRELIPDFEAQGAPIESPVEEDLMYFMTKDEAVQVPFLPPSLRQHGNFIISLGQMVRWLGKQAEALGINVFPGFPAVDVLLEKDQVVGVRTGDKGVDKHGQRKANFEAGVDIKAKVTIVGEGPRGSLTRILCDRFRLREGRAPQVYATGVKEIWEMPAGRVQKGRVIHTMGWPLPNSTFGGAFVYGMDDTRWAVGFVTGLDAKDPTSDPHANLQRFKTHPYIRALIEGGRCTSYGAKAIPEGGFFSMPKLSAPGVLLCGDSGGFLNGARLKGVHLAIKSGMLAAETLLECLIANDFSPERLASYERRFETSWAYAEMRSVRNFHQNFDGGLFAGMAGTGLGMVTGGRDLFLRERAPGHPGYERMEHLKRAHPNGKPAPFKGDGQLTFDKLADVYLSGTKHDEDQPVHLLVADTNVCATKCREEYGNPCQHFCPAAVYEMVPDESRGPDALKLHINASNCVHCKTCDIADPYQIITWVPPEGGGGPDYKNL